MSDFSAIYEAVIGCGTPAQLGDCWHGYPCSSAFVELPGDSAVLQAVLKDFATADLVAAGVVTPDGELVAALRGGDSSSGGSLAIALRAHEGSPPFAIVSDLQLVGGSAIAAVAMLGDYRLQGLLEGAEGLPVACSMADLVALWSVDQPTVPITGLEQLGGSDLKVLTTPIPWKPAGDDLNAGDEVELIRLDLFFVNWRPACIEGVDQLPINAVAAHLNRLDNLLNVGFDNSVTWKPRDQELDRLRYALEVLPGNVPAIISRSLEVDLAKLIQSNQASTTEEPKYRELLERWIASGHETSNDSQALWLLLQARQEKELISPILDEAKRETDPIRMNGLVRLASLYRQYHTCMALLSKELNGLPVGTQLADHDQEKRVISLEKRIAEISAALRPAESAAEKRQSSWKEPVIPTVAARHFVKT